MREKKSGEKKKKRGQEVNRGVGCMVADILCREGASCHM